MRASGVFAIEIVRPEAWTLSGQLDPFDLDAASLRRSQVELSAFVEALAVRLEGALPGRVEDRKSVV